MPLLNYTTKVDASKTASEILGILARIGRSPETIRRFWAKVDKNGPVPEHRPELGPCWVWTGGLSGNGYGAFAVTHDQQIGAHRFAYWLAHGVLATVTRHECDREICVRDAHLIDGTPKDNVRDRDSRGRGKHWPTTPERRARGDRHGRAKVTEADVRAIRLAYANGEASQSQIGARYGITQAVVGRIINRKSWAHVQ